MKPLLLGALLLFAGSLGAEPRPDPGFPGADSRVARNAICACRGVLYIGGDFTAVGGQRRDGVAAIEISSGKLLPWAPALASPSVAAIACKDGVVYLGGSFKRAQGQSQPYLAAYSEAGEGEARLLSNWNPRLDAPAADILPAPDGTLFVGGRFEKALLEIEDARHGNGRATGFEAGLDGRVCGLVFDPNDPSALIAAGRFKNSHGQPRSLIARLDRKSGGLLPQQAKIAGSPAMEILRMITHSGTLYAVGVEIMAVDGQARSNAFALNPSTFALQNWRADLDAGAGALSAWGDKIVIGGDFRHVNGASRRLAVLDAESGELSSYDPLPDHNTYAALAMHDVLFISGYWTHLGGQGVEHFAALRNTE